MLGLRGAGLARRPGVCGFATQLHSQVEDPEDVVAKFASCFRNAFPLRLSMPRTIGREAEFPVVWTDSGERGDVPKLLEALDKEGDLRLKQQGDIGLYHVDPAYEYSLEVGLGTVEVIVGPCPDLHSLRKVTETAVYRISNAAESLGMSLLGFGMQPKTRPSPELLSPRSRYFTMRDVMGPDWDWFTVTSSDQVHIDITAPELSRVLNVVNVAAPLLVALCGNSSVLGGEPAPWISTREGAALAGKHASRSGLPDGPFYCTHDYISALMQLPMLLRPRTQQEEWDGAPLLQAANPNSRFYDMLKSAGFDWESFDVHTHYLWHAGRPRTRQRTIEVRPVCQQPWEDHMVTSALCLGLVQSAATIVHEPSVKSLLDWGVARALYPKVCEQGLDALPHLREPMRAVLDICSDALHSRGLGEEIYLAPLYKRLSSCTNPGQAAVRVLEAGGLPALVEHLRIPTGP